MQLPWEEPGWIEKTTVWIHAQLEEHNLRASSPVEIIHQRPWSTFARLSTEDGIVYFKAPAPAFKYEAALTQALANWRPDCSVPVLAVDFERGWILSANAGDTLRSMYRSLEQIEHWEKVLPLYVELQIDMTERLPELLALGMPDRRLLKSPHLYTQILEDTENLPAPQILAQEIEIACGCSC